MDVVLRFGPWPWQRKKVTVSASESIHIFSLYHNLSDMMQLGEDEFFGAGFSDSIVFNVSRKAFRRLRDGLPDMTEKAVEMGE